MALSDENIRRLSDMHVRSLMRQEGRFEREMRILFNAQRVETIRRLRDMGRAEIKDLNLTGNVVARQGAGEPLFSAEEWLERYNRDGGPLIMSAIVEGGQEQIAEFGLGISFDVQHPMVQEWAKERTQFWASRTNDETARLLMSEIEDAQALGESIRQIEGRMEKVFTFNNEIRAERIARTEMQTSVNRGHLEAYRQSNVTEGVMWIATLDDRTRDSHRAMHKKTVPKGTPFDVNGHMMEGPGQGGPPAEVINCRCTTAPVVRKGARGVDGHEDILGETRKLVDALSQETGERLIALSENIKESSRRKRIVTEIERDIQGFPIRKVEEEQDA